MVRFAGTLPYPFLRLLGRPVTEPPERIERGMPEIVGERPSGKASEKNKPMKILLYSPDNGVTRNFMPHLWMFLLQSLTPPGHEVVLIDGHVQPIHEVRIAQYD